MYKYVFLLFVAVATLACQKKESGDQTPAELPEKVTPEAESKPQPPAFDIQGHRGMRGYYPENTLEGFVFVLSMEGLSTLEMDAVITADREVILSHEPWFSSEICTDPEGNRISSKKEKSYNIFEMDYSEVEAFKCGDFPHPRFPEQEKAGVSKPRLADVIDAVEREVARLERDPVYYNIEIKSNPEGDGIYHPQPAEFVDLLLNVVKQKYMIDRSIIQSFDVRALQEVKKKDPRIKLALLVGAEEDGMKKMERLGFDPDIYSPNHQSLDKATVEDFHKKSIKVIPWTVNDEAAIQKMIEMGVDGIISDYPDRVARVKSEFEETPES